MPRSSKKKSTDVKPKKRKRKVKKLTMPKKTRNVDKKFWTGIPLTPDEVKKLGEKDELKSLPKKAEAVIEMAPKAKKRAGSTAYKKNGRWLSSKNKDAKTNNWESRFLKALEPFKPNKPFAGPVSITVIGGFEKNKAQKETADFKPDQYLLHTTTPDFDNIVKIAVDAIADNWLYDDAYVAHNEVVKLLIPKDAKPFVYIKVEAITTETAKVKRLSTLVEKRREAQGLNREVDLDLGFMSE